MNRLGQATSPYLLQHANNPVHWQPYDEQALADARTRNLPMFVSIGYSACHWCHVMEHETFENHEAAEILNAHFVCIKIDREERPDIDHFYMDAAHLMGQQGGWPLNMFALPDGRPFYGGTYFPRTNFMAICLQLAATWHERREDVQEYAARLTEGVAGTNTLIATPEGPLPVWPALAEEAFKSAQKRFDNTLGGFGSAPKFPMPTVHRFLLYYALFAGNAAARSHVQCTLETMAEAGIHDQLGGGFCRYSTDRMWLVPHFEKMLYDNAQLLGLYAQAGAALQSDYLQRIAPKIFAFCEAELANGHGGYYAALDADSEGEEGKFYVWTTAEVERTLGPLLAPLAMARYGMGTVGVWEHGKNILVLAQADVKLRERFALSPDAYEAQCTEIDRRLFAERNTRIRPGLDDKTLCAWNALMLTGLCQCAALQQNDAIRTAAHKLHRFLTTELLQGTALFRTWKPGQAAIPAFAEDYALLIEALIAYHQLTGEESILHQAAALLNHMETCFFVPEQGLYLFGDYTQNSMPAPKLELTDNVIPGVNSIMANNLFALGHLLARPQWIARAQAMLHTVSPECAKHGTYYANWATLATRLAADVEVAVVIGPDATGYVAHAQRTLSPFRLWLWADDATSLPLALMQGKGKPGQTLLYVCKGQVCDAPVVVNVPLPEQD